MKREVADILIQISTLIALIVGIGLVIYEIKQTRALWSIQHSYTQDVMYHEMELAVLGENFAETLARIQNGSALTDSDLVKYDSYVSTVLLRIGSHRVSHREGIFVPWKKLYANQMCWYFGHDVGQAWLTEGTGVLHDQEVVTFILENTKNCGSSKILLSDMKKKLEETRGDGGS